MGTNSLQLFCIFKTIIVAKHTPVIFLLRRLIQEYHCKNEARVASLMNCRLDWDTQ